MQIEVYKQTGEEAGKTELPDAVFGLKWNADLVRQVVVSQLANQRPMVAHVKDRSEVRGGGKKPWRQKGTGRARHGSIRSPIWKGGGVTHGPDKKRNPRKKINKKMAKKALWTVLSAKARDRELIILEGFSFSEPKTKFAAIVFEKLSQHKNFDRIRKNNGVLVALSEKEKNIKRVLRNLPYVGTEEARNLNAHQLLQFKYLLLPHNTLSIFK